MITNFPLIATFCSYLVITLAIGFVAYRATSSLSDYILGGRQLSPTITALSVCASDMSGWLLLALPGAVYLSGLNKVWLGIGLFIGAFANWQLIAKRLRIYTVKVNNALTIPDYLEKRLEDKSGIIRVVSATTTLVFFVFYTASGLVGGALLFSEMLGLPYMTALWLGSSVIILYTFAGGFLAVSWTDTFQGMLMLLALIILPASAFWGFNDISTTFTEVQQSKPELLNLFHDLTPIAALSFLAWGLGYAGQPHILTRFMAIQSPQDMSKSRNIAMSWQLLALIGACLVGLSGAIIYAGKPLENPETVFIHLAHTLCTPWVAGILIAAIMSAIMSTVDSQLLVCSSAISEDFYKRWLKPNATDRELIFVSRLAIAVVALAALWCASDPNSKILDLVSYAWAGFGATFGPIILISLHWKGLTRNGALAGILAGTATVILWPKLHGGIFDVYELLPGFLFNALVTFIVSTLDSNKPSDRTINTFESMENEA